MFAQPLATRMATTIAKGMVVFCYLALSTVAYGQNFPDTRDPWLWPFDAQSIWNMPIGSDAIYVTANLQDGLRTFIDEEVLEIIPAGSPLRPLYAPGSWQLRCDGMRSPTGNPRDTIFIPIPDDFIVPDAAPPQTPNNSAALLQPDGQTVISIGPMARCDTSGAVYGWYADVDSLTGQGYFGSHGGSGLSALGGSIRLGDLTGDDPIRHAIKINIWGERYLNYDPNSPTPGYRWPARQTDSYAATVYGGNNPELVLGSLMAIPPHLTPQDLGLTTIPAIKLFHALQDYGAYIVDDSAWDVTAFCMAYGVPEEFEAFTGYSIRQNDPNHPWYQEYYALVRNLHIVVNNSPANIGGGGTPRQPLAPPFDPQTSISPTTATPLTFSLGQNFPNPFNPSTTIPFSLRKASIVSLRIFDVQGRQVGVLLEKERLPSGRHTISWKGLNNAGRAVGSGVFWYWLTVDGHGKAGQMTLLR